MTRHLTIDDITRITVPFAPALSPDGASIVYVVRTPDVDADAQATSLWLAADGAEPRQLTHGDSDQSPAFSPDGTKIAFTRTVDDAPQIFVMDAAGGEPRAVTSLHLGAGAPVWSPDSARIAFVGTVDAAPDAPAHAPLVVRRLDYQMDGAGVLGTSHPQLHIVEVATGAVRCLTHGDALVDAPAWSPDGERIAFTAGSARAGHSMVRPVWVIDALDEKADPTRVALDAGYAGTVLWTADAQSLIIAGYLAAPRGHVRLVRVDLATGEVTDLASALDRNVMTGGPAYPGASPALVDDTRVLFAARDRGLTHLYSVPVAGGEIEPVFVGDGRVVAGMSVAAGIAAVVLITPESFGEIVTIDLASGAETVRTTHGSTLADVTVYPKTERTFAISDGTEVHGWVIADPEQQGARPLLVDVHGGPHNAWNDVADEMHVYHQDLVARGWAVVILNPRGSDGYGEQFYTAVDGGWGVNDGKDFLEPVDQLVGEGLADPGRLAIAGYSYGGYMTCYLTANDDRFAAAMAGGVVSDLQSLIGTCDMGDPLGEVELGGYPWEIPDAYAEQSPITRVAQVTTPTLVLHGEADRRCPVGQAQQWYSSLAHRGVETEMVLYPGASHEFPLAGRISHRLDYNRRVLEWLHRFAGDAAGARPAPIDAAHWQNRLDALATRHGIVGAQLGVLRLGSGLDGEEVVLGSFGTLNQATDAPVTNESIFQIGSISKVWTSTIIMQLIEEEKFTLDTPVIEILPSLKLIDAEANAGVTVRHLLTHTSGIDGDIFTDTGRGDDAVDKLVALLADATQNHPLGASWSYCNAGFVMLGAIIQATTGETWESAIDSRLAKPMGLERTVTLPEQALRFGAATGHIPSPDGSSVPTPQWEMPRSVGPAGLIVQSAEDLLQFAALHLRGGITADGTRVISAEHVEQMAAHQTDLPDTITLGDSWGLGWIRFNWDGHSVYGHDGSTLGQNGFLRVLPEQKLALTLLVNGGHSNDFFGEFSREFFADVAHVALPTPFTPPRTPMEVDASAFLGVYERESVRMEVIYDEAGQLTLTTQTTGAMAELAEDPPESYPMTAVTDHIFAIQAPGTVSWIPVTFFTLDNGQPYMHFGARATPLASAS